MRATSFQEYCRKRLGRDAETLANKAHQWSRIAKIAKNQRSKVRSYSSKYRCLEALTRLGKTRVVHVELWPELTVLIEIKRSRTSGSRLHCPFHMLQDEEARRLIIEGIASYLDRNDEDSTMIRELIPTCPSHPRVSRQESFNVVCEHST